MVVGVGVVLRVPIAEVTAAGLLAVATVAAAAIRVVGDAPTGTTTLVVVVGETSLKVHGHFFLLRVVFFSSFNYFFEREFFHGMFVRNFRTKSKNSERLTEAFLCSIIIDLFFQKGSDELCFYSL